MVSWYQNTLNLIYVISFVDLFAVGLTVPLFTTHLKSLGASYGVIGLITSIYSGLQVVSGPIIGGWSDIKDRKTVLQITLFICALCYGLLGLTKSLFFIFVLRLILGCTKHIQSICKAVITDLVPVNEQTGIYGKSVAYASLGFILGPFLGGHLIELSNGWNYVCLFTMVLFLINLGLASRITLTNKRNLRKQNNLNILSKLKEEWKHVFGDLVRANWKSHWESFLIRFLFGLTITTYFSQQALFLKDKYKLSDRYVGYLISFFSTVGLVSAYFLNYINSFYKTDEQCLQRLVHFFTLLTFSIFGIYVSPNLHVFMVLLIPLSMAATVLRVVSMELMLKNAAEKNRGSLSGASNSVMSVARFVAPLFSGFLGDIVGEQSVLLIAVFPAALGVIVSLHLARG